MHLLTTPQPIDSARVRTLCMALCGRYGFLGMTPIGRSLLGRDIPALWLGEGHDAVLYAAAFHAQESITALVLLRLCEQICRAAEQGVLLEGLELRGILAERRLVFLPLVNPDGVDIALHGSKAAGRFCSQAAALGADTKGLWQANARGVDLNHNFNAGWNLLHEQERAAGILGPAPRRYGGPHPESEPETAALVRLCRATPFRLALALHTQGEEIYWHYGDRTPPRARMMAEVLAASGGYTVSHPEGLAAHGGFKDWFIDTFARPGFTLEMGKGHNPLPLSDFEKLYAKAREMLLIAALL